MNWYECLADASVRAVALGAMAGVLVLFLRRSPAAQHAMWTLVTIGMLALPVLRPVVPAAYVYVVERPAPAATIARPAAQLAHNAGGISAPAPAARTGPAALRLRWPVYAAIAYMAGVVLFAVRLFVGLWMTRRLVRAARPIDAGVDVDVEESDQVRVPVTIGLKAHAGTASVRLARVAGRKDEGGPGARVGARAPLRSGDEPHCRHKQVADDAGLAVSADSGSYARVLLEVAARMEGQDTRLIWNCSAMNGQLVARRIRRVMDSRTQPGGRAIGRPGPRRAVVERRPADLDFRGSGPCSAWRAPRPSLSPRVAMQP